MLLKEDGRYETVSGVKVHMQGALDHIKVLFNYGYELAKILGINDKSWEEIDELLKDHKVLTGLTDDLIMPSGDWHDKTGKCLMGNTGGSMGRGDELRKRLARFDIKMDEEKNHFMTPEELQKYKEVQSIAKETIEFLKSFIKEGLFAKEIKDAAEKFMREKGATSFWYYNIGAFVFVGKETAISVSGREYRASDKKVQSEDLVTVDLGPEINGFRGDFARSFAVQDGKVVTLYQSKSPEIIQGMEAEIKLHEAFKNMIHEETNFEDIYTKMNALIEEFGFENLDFKKNLGHSIEKHQENRIYIETGNKARFKDVGLFTFEPHIRKKKGKYGFKHENIYYFDQGQLKTL